MIPVVVWIYIILHLLQVVSDHLLHHRILIIVDVPYNLMVVVRVVIVAVVIRQAVTLGNRTCKETGFLTEIIASGKVLITEL